MILLISYALAPPQVGGHRPDGKATRVNRIRMPNSLDFAGACGHISDAPGEIQPSVRTAPETDVPDYESSSEFTCPAGQVMLLRVENSRFFPRTDDRVVRLAISDRSDAEGTRFHPDEFVTTVQIGHSAR